MFERPTKNDLDTALSMLMHDSRHKLTAELQRCMSEATLAGALQSTRLVVVSVNAADVQHKDTIEQAQIILLDFIERMQRSPVEIVGWARPHLENLGNSLLGLVKPHGFPQDRERLTNQYRAVFQQRLDIMLRNVEIGHQTGAGFARAEKVETQEEWIRAADAVRLLAPDGKGEYSAKMTLCKRAHAGMLRSRAERFIVGGRARDNVELPTVFWWAEGHEALHANWRTGDFDTWPKGQPSLSDVHLEAFNVSFLWTDLERIMPPPKVAPASLQEDVPPPRNKGGRPKREFWEELWVEIARQLYVGDLKPKTQADIENAMHQWIVAKGYTAGESTVRDRARMLWRVIQQDGN